MSKYDVYSEFDLEKHKATYTNYLEVLIDETGKVMYAVPSHQEKAIRIACEKLEISREELNQMCPRKYWCDYMKWLCLITGVVAVWNDTCVCGNHATKAQAATLRRLKLAGVYKGPLPPTKYVLPADLTAEILAAGYEIEHDDDGCYHFGRYSPAGQDFGFTIDPGGSIMDLIHALYEYWDAYDVSYETFIWLDSSGHGGNGAPYDMRDCYDDMEICRGYIHELYSIINNYGDRETAENDNVQEENHDDHN